MTTQDNNILGLCAQIMDNYRLIPSSVEPNIITQYNNKDALYTACVAVNLENVLRGIARPSPEMALRELLLQSSWAAAKVLAVRAEEVEHRQKREKRVGD